MDVINSLLYMPPYNIFLHMPPIISFSFVEETRDVDLIFWQCVHWVKEQLWREKEQIKGKSSVRTRW